MGYIILVIAQLCISSGVHVFNDDYGGTINYGIIHLVVFFGALALFEVFAWINWRKEDSFIEAPGTMSILEFEYRV